MADERKVVRLAASGKPETLAEGVAELRRILPARIEYQKVMAKLQREAYLAYVAEGFTPKQALELVKDMGP